MIPTPAIRSEARATTTMVFELRMLVATLLGVHDHRKPFSIRSRDLSAMSTTSDQSARPTEISGRVIFDPPTPVSLLRSWRCHWCRRWRRQRRLAALEVAVRDAFAVLSRD